MPEIGIPEIWSVADVAKMSPRILLTPLVGENMGMTHEVIHSALVHSDIEVVVEYNGIRDSPHKGPIS
jgi:hypothetical protein